MNPRPIISRREGGSARRQAVLLLLGLSLLMVSEQARGQLRVYGRVQPNAEDPANPLVFDVNSVNSDNISPNVIFSRDGRRGYTAYTGSGVILGFSPESGEVLDRIQTGGKPFAMTLHPDGRTLVVPSAFDNKIFLVNMDLRQSVATFAFENAQFGFGSVVALSPDGGTGYISSTGTGEVIKFNLQDGKEIGRLKGMEAPAQITLTPDGATLLVVDTLKEELVFADAAALTRRKAMRGPNDRAINFTLFNKPVLAPDGSTGIIASRDPNGVLGSDTAILFNTSTGDLMEVASIGNEPGFTGLTPDGKNWVIFNQLSLSVISTTNFSSRRELSLVRGEPLGSANVVFSADSRYAYYASSESDMVFQHDLERDIVVSQVPVGDSGQEISNQASSIAITPDGKSLAVVNFNTNNLDLLAPAYFLSSATLVVSPDRFTGVSLINLAPTNNRFTLVALNIYGEPIQGGSITTPAVIDLPPNQQITQTLSEIFHFEADKEVIGWLSIYAERPEAIGYLSIGDAGLSRLDAAPLFRAGMSEWIVPDILKAESVSLEMDLVNPNFNQANYDLALYGKDGRVIEEQKNQIAYPTNRHARYLSDIFPNLPDTNEGYLRFSTRGDLLLMTLLQSPTAFAALNGIEVSRYAGVKKLYSPQFAVAPGFRTILNVINAGEGDADITVTLHQADGSVVGQPYAIVLARNAQLKASLDSLFQEDPAVANVTGWLEVETSQDRLIGTVSFTNEEGGFLSAFELLGHPSGRFLFPVLAQDDTYQTGIALLNAGDEPATVTLEVWGIGGTVDNTTTFVLNPRNRTAVYLNSYFPDMGPRLQGHIRVRSDKELYGMSLIHDAGFNFMTAIPAFPIP